MKRILWISGRAPAPLYSGDAIYSAGLIEALAVSGKVAIHVFGAERAGHKDDEKPFGLPGVTCSIVRPVNGVGFGSLVSSLPRDAYNLASALFRKELNDILGRGWDWIVIDHANSAGVLDMVKNRGVPICYIAHNAEGLVRPSVAGEFDGIARRAVMRLDAEKYRRLERKIVEVANAVVCITGDDAAYFHRFCKNIHVIPPVYLGTVSPARTIVEACPRSLILLGSFEWAAKQRNLQQILEGLVPTLRRNAIGLQIVGAVPETIRTKHEGDPFVTFHGRLPDVRPLFETCRGGLVAEVLGGGFKLKILDYAFAGMPIFGLRTALTGMAAEERSAIFEAESLSELASLIVRNIDDLEGLNRRQTELQGLVAQRFGLAAGIKGMSRVFLG
ncbi:MULTISPECIES: glycosyltransferase [unclassified Bradyrhizobium]|uniref:glycosyltransferase n=1 Tax=unclassified Bradyrhizobium TaxID=2631580 RepID=UPI001CD30993|nr:MULTISPECIES: glycosyltransferase [unclassified Bradyrhizobium]MCA1426784.1 glycosyltransferase [Bradyrhizobium sp. NBAIM16]MCA1505571.1 glycosyltransferase [Bradyrhizobium sp. NBAIM02]